METADRAAFAQLQAAILKVNMDNGWFDSERPIDADIALLHSEVSEMYEAFRLYGLDDVTLQNSVANGPSKPEGFGSELADVLIRVFDTAERRNVNLAWEVNRKLEYNRTRGYRHGGKRV